MNGKTPKACEGCRLRKVKCNGQQPCQQCNHLNLSCNYSAPRDRSRQIVRGSRLALLKTPRGQQQRTLPPLVRKPSPTNVNSWHCHDYSEGFFLSLLDNYESVVYPVNPVIPRSEIEVAIMTMDYDATSAALVYAYAAVTINLSRISFRDANGDISAQIRDFMTRSFTSRSTADAGDDYSGLAPTMAVSIQKIMTCLFLEISLMALKRFDKAWLMLREAISMIQMLEVQDRKESRGNDVDVARYQRMYWELFIHERFTTILMSYPSILPPLRSPLPLADPTISPHVNVGFTRLIRLFLILDDDFLRHWIAQNYEEEDAKPEMTISWIEHKQQQLDDDEHTAAYDTRSSVLTELQVADLFVTRVWLRTLVWQLAMSRCLLSSAPPSSAHEGLSLAFPAQRLSTQLRSLVDTLKSQTSITMHGSGILQKLFEITNTIADVMTVVSNPGLDAAGSQRVRDLVFLVEMLLSFERIDQVQRNILKSKMEALVDKFPGFGVPELNFHG
ncbi:hypothetical protein GE09DRAFT_226859 [Coniochaeta sp. 2T2.1]|nr:hypothetical protein GE09DRAFT_226859 [Coniochaeta sp. 2T2.1]